MSGLRRLSRLSSPRRQLAQDTLALRVRHRCPTCDLIERPAAPRAKSSAGVDRAHVEARGLDWPLSPLSAVKRPRACRNVKRPGPCCHQRTMWISRHPAHRLQCFRPGLRRFGGAGRLWRSGQRLQRRHGARPGFGQANNGFGPLAQLRSQLERAPCRLTRFCDGQASPVPPAVSCASEPLPNACITRGSPPSGMPVSFPRPVCPPSGVKLSVRARTRGELQGIRHQVEADLADGALVGPDLL
jgi:hypothetical protein